MANLSITPANVAYVSGPTLADQVAGEAFDTGALVYFSPTTGTWLKAQCDGTANEAGAVRLGLALFTAAAAAQRGTIAITGAIVDVGAGTAGIAYAISRTAGLYAPSADMASTDKVTVAALGIGSNQLLLTRIYNAGSVLA